MCSFTYQLSKNNNDDKNEMNSDVAGQFQNIIHFISSWLLVFIQSIFNSM